MATRVFEKALEDAYRPLLGIQDSWECERLFTRRGFLLSIPGSIGFEGIERTERILHHRKLGVDVCYARNSLGRFQCSLRPRNIGECGDFHVLSLSVLASTMSSHWHQPFNQISQRLAISNHDIGGYQLI
jgi:hypothetical protein